ncbi:MAG TPA: hydantoinase/oxoprolinase family protein [Acidimicrobiales bacterium]|nr:hydantoinase/oxoprolinase family protein [Acidimicrobiales bacterium]
MRVGVDTGGTFTDAVAEDGTIVKVLSIPDDPAAAVRDAVEALGDPSRSPRPTVLAHGTTIATNALLERTGATVALVTTAGFADVVEIARQDRPSLYDPFADRPRPLVERRLRFEVGGRLGPNGDELEPVDLTGLLPLPGGVEAVAVCLLHSDLSAGHETTVARALRDAGHDVTASSDVSPEFREYERTLTTVVNAYLRRPCRDYLSRLAVLADAVFVLTSAGGLVPVADAAGVPAALLLSGPAGGVLAGAAAAAANGFGDSITFDMGGTSTDVCLVRGAVPEPAPERLVAGFPIRLPSVDVHTIGAGGGSIARIDVGGALAVGPASAGAVPGPACYGRGGDAPTVTDADLVLGRIPADHPFPGLGVLDVAAAASTLERAGVDPAGVVTVVNAAMEQAVRTVTVARGVDPRSCALVAFGGAGPLHACELADALGITSVVVPARAGVLSAVGLLGAPLQRELVRSWPVPSSVDGIDVALESLAAEARELVGVEAVTSTYLDVRYAGQSHELTVARVDDFHAEHARRNGYARRDAPVEVVALRARARIDSPVPVSSLVPPSAPRKPATGPAVIAEPDCTIWIPAGWVARVGAAGALVIERTAIA